jgi:succinate dehydrogenase/fumarate reductase flavoprotein subunit
LVDLDRVQLHPTGFVDPKNPDDRTKTLAAELLRGVGGLIFDKTGLRFTDELGTRQAVVNGMLKRAGEGVKEVDRTFFLVLNSKAAAVADRHRDLYTAKGLLTKVSGVSKLAEFTNMSQISLTKTMQAYNVAAEKGQDEFGRSVFPAHVPIDLTEDFFVGQVTPVIHYTMGGIAIDTEARVLSASDEAPIPGLFAIGEASGGVHGDNRLAGNSLLECLVFGRQVGTAMPILAGTATRPQAVERPAVAEEPASDQGQLREITAEELAAHKSDVWVALYGHVYDFSAYAEEHPGGEEAVHDVAGIDGTVKFEAVHNRDVLEKMGFQPIGRFR